MKVIIDTREKQPWNILLGDHITEVISHKLDCGDYSIDTLEELVAIERKKSVSELAINITEDRFWRAIDRLEKVRHPLLIVETTLSEFYRYPNIASVPAYLRDKIKVSPAFLISSINDIMSRRIPVIFAGDVYQAEKIANDFLVKMIKKYART